MSKYSGLEKIEMERDPIKEAMQYAKDRGVFNKKVFE